MIIRITRGGRWGQNHTQPPGPSILAGKAAPQCFSCSSAWARPYYTDVVRSTARVGRLHCDSGSQDLFLNPQHRWDSCLPSPPHLLVHPQSLPRVQNPCVMLLKIFIVLNSYKHSLYTIQIWKWVYAQLIIIYIKNIFLHLLKDHMLSDVEPFSFESTWEARTFCDFFMGPTV